MKLFYSTSSPYSRKARMAIQFKQLSDEVDQIVCNPFVEAPEDTHQNPLGKVPTLLLENGSPLFDSPVICEYLDSLNDVNPLYPGDIQEKFNVKIAEALADGILDAAYNVVMERRRPEGESSNKAINDWMAEIERALPEAEKLATKLNGNVNQAHIALYSTLGYLEFRLPDITWRSSRILSDWFTEFENSHPHVKETKPY